MRTEGVVECGVTVSGGLSHWCPHSPLGNAVSDVLTPLPTDGHIQVIIMEKHLEFSAEIQTVWKGGMCRPQGPTYLNF